MGGLLGAVGGALGGGGAVAGGKLMLPTVSVGSGTGTPLSDDTRGALTRVVVDTSVHLPDMFEIRFVDQSGSILDQSGIDIGTTISIAGAKDGASSTTPLITGEVTSIEAICVHSIIETVVRGYEKAHKLQRGRRSRTFVNMSDSDIAREVASKAGLEVDTIDDSKTVWDHVAQVAETDWEFLKGRAQEIGFDVGVSGGKFFFRRGPDMPPDSGGLGGALGTLASAAAAVGNTIAGALGLGGGSGDLTFGANLLTFLPRISGANLTPDVEVRVWDPDAANVVTGNTGIATKTATIDGEDPKKLASGSTGGLIPPIPISFPSIPGLPSLNIGAPPSNTAYVVVDRPLGVGSVASKAADQTAKSVADYVASTFAEAEGVALGDPAIQAGAQVTVAAVPKQFAGKWTVTQSRHVFDVREMGYQTHFVVSGRADRSLLGLTAGATAGRTPQIGGFVCGVVTNVNDTKKLGRVKVTLPWLAPDFETDWARVVQLAAGARTGAMFLPEPGDEVLVGFEFGDVRRPYVIGGLVNSKSSFSTLSSAVKAAGPTAAVVTRGMATPAGNVLQFEDELVPGAGAEAPPTTSKITLGTGDGNLSLVIDQAGGTVTLSCKPAPPKSKTPAGTLTIDCSGAGTVSIKGGTGGIKIESEGQLELNGKLGVKIESSAMVQVQGQMIQLN